MKLLKQPNCSSATACRQVVVRRDPLPQETPQVSRVHATSQKSPFPAILTLTLDTASEACGRDIPHSIWVIHEVDMRIMKWKSVGFSFLKSEDQPFISQNQKHSESMESRRNLNLQTTPSLSHMSVFCDESCRRCCTVTYSVSIASFSSFLF